MTESQQSDSPVYECLNGWFEVEGDIDDFIFYVERPNQSESESGRSVAALTSFRPFGISDEKRGTAAANAGPGWIDLPRPYLSAYCGTSAGLRKKLRIFCSRRAASW